MYWGKINKETNIFLGQATSTNKSVTALHDRISELEQEKEELQSALQAFSELKAQNGKK